MSAVLQFFKLEKTELRLWFVGFVVLVISFLPGILDFIWGNHDWLPLLDDSSWKSGLIEGRFAQYVFPKLLFMGKILPIFTVLFGFLFYSLAIVLLYTRFFEFSVSKTTIFPIVAAILLPYINEILYFKFIVLSQLTWPLIVVFALLAGKRAWLTKHFVINTFFCFLFLLFAMGGYPACVNLFVTAVALWVIQISMSEKSVKKLSLCVVPFVISLIAAFLSLYFIYSLLIKHQMMISLYNNEYLSFGAVLAKVIPTVKMLFVSLLQPQPFFSLFYNIIVVCLFFNFIGNYLLKSDNYKQCLLRLGLIFGLLLCLKFSAWISNDTTQEYYVKNDPISFMVRANFYAWPVLVLFCLAFGMSQRSKIFKNVNFVFGILLIVQSINANYDSAKVQSLGFEAEMRLQNRIISRIQNSPQYVSHKYYNIVQAGELSFRPRYYVGGSNEKYGYYLLKTPFTRFWLPGESYNAFMPETFVGKNSGIYPKDISMQMLSFLGDKFSVWPSEKSVYVDDNYGIIILSSEGRKMMNDQFMKLQRVLP